MKKVLAALFGAAIIGLGVWLLLAVVSMAWPSALKYVVAILGLAALMIVHEGGHYFAARASGLRVTKFSIGFGPTFFKIQPDVGFWWFTAFGDRIKFKLFPHDPERHGPTVFQVAAIPFLAYVQIAGMNPLEDNDPNDKGSYANASLRARVVTIFAGPLANYVFASIFFFAPLYAAGVPDTEVQVVADSPAAAAGLKDGDRIVEIDGAAVGGDWEKMSSQIVGNADRTIQVVVQRGEERLTLDVTPRRHEKENRGVIGVQQSGARRPVGVGEAAVLSLLLPTEVVKNAVTAIPQLFKKDSGVELGGPTAIVNAIAHSLNWKEFLFILGQISTSLAVFNLLPIPALDGGRLMFLGYEATTRKRPNQTVEAHIHAIGLLMMLGLMVYVTIANDLGFAK